MKKGITMKKILFLFSVVLFLTAGVEAKVYTPEDLIPCEDAFCDKDGNLLSGEFQATYSSGKIKYKGQYNFGLPEGVFTLYREDGSLHQEETYKQGKKNGLKKTYNNEGKITAEALFNNGVIDEYAKFYYPDGKIFAQMSYKEGKLDGTSQFFDEAGLLRAELNVEDGKAVSGYEYDELGRKSRMKYKDIQAFMKKYPQ